jgi:hypothetical protein
MRSTPNGHGAAGANAPAAAVQAANGKNAPISESGFISRDQSVLHAA